MKYICIGQIKNYFRHLKFRYCRCKNRPQHWERKKSMGAFDHKINVTNFRALAIIMQQEFSETVSYFKEMLLCLQTRSTFPVSIRSRKVTEQKYIPYDNHLQKLLQENFSIKSLLMKLLQLNLPVNLIRSAILMSCDICSNDANQDYCSRTYHSNSNSEG